MVQNIAVIPEGTQISKLTTDEVILAHEVI